MTVLVTGGCGYLGRVYCRLLLETTPEDIVIVDDAPLPECLKGFRQLKHLQQSIFSLWESFPVYDIVHLASLTSLRDSFSYPKEYWKNILNGGCVVAEQMWPDSRLIFASTASDIPSPYVNAKRAIERYYQDIATRHEQICTLRFGNLSGGVPEWSCYEEHDPETHLIPLAVRAAREGTPLPVHNNGEDKRHYLHVLDAAKAIEIARVRKHSIPYEAFTVRGPYPFSTSEIIKKVEEIEKKEINKILVENDKNDHIYMVKSENVPPNLPNWAPTLGLERIILTQK